MGIAPFEALKSSQGNGPHSVVTINGQVPARIATAIIQLAEAQWHTAVGRNAWDFAVEIGNLHVGPNDVRWLIYNGLVEHGWDVTPVGANNRSFRHNMRITLSQQSSFVATAAGLSLAGACSAAIKAKPRKVVQAINGKGRPSLPKGPHWNPPYGEFYVDGVLIKRFSSTRRKPRADPVGLSGRWLAIIT